MKTTRLVCIASLLLLAAASTNAQQPPNPTPSDSFANTAGGTDALLNLVTPDGQYNTAFGHRAMISTDTGWLNTAVGHAAMSQNTSGIGNTGIGSGALSFNADGEYNTAIGAFSQEIGTLPGNRNTSVGYQSLRNTGGDDNAVVGFDALRFNTTGSQNAVVGAQAHVNSGTASRSVAIGYGALEDATAGDNIAVGYMAGASLTTGSYNITIGHLGNAGEARTIRIGNPSVLNPNRQDRAFIAGIYGQTISGGSTVLIDSKGQLGTVVSSGRFKEGVTDMGDASSDMLKLRPVTFRYKADANKTRQFGLIAEEVAKIYPNLVVRSETGEIDSVQYHELAPMLLNELQKQNREIEALRKEVARIDELRSMVQEQAAAFTMLKARLDATASIAGR